MLLSLKFKCLKFVLIFLIIRHTIQHKHADFTVKVLQDSEILFEPVGRAHFYTETNILMTKIKIPDFTEEMDWVQQAGTALEGVCSPQKTTNNIKDDCLQYLFNIRHQMEEVNDINRRLLHETYYAEKRTKRSFFDGIGSLVKFLIGNLDAADGRDIYEKINELDVSEKETIKLISKQVTIIKSVYEKTNETLRAMKLHEEQIRDEIGRLRYSLQQKIPSIETRLDTIEYAALISMELSKIHNKQEELLDIITSLNMGKLHPSILNAEAVMDIYGKIMDNLEFKNREYHNFQLLTQIMEVNSIQNKNDIYIKILIPVPDKDMFKLNKIYTLPVTHDHGLERVLVIRYNYLAVNNFQELAKYMLLDSEDFNQCVKIKMDSDITQFLCKQLKPITAITSKQCILKLYVNNSIDDKLCRNMYKPQSEKIIKMYTKNNWLYITHEPKIISIQCKEEQTDIIVNKTSVITIQPLCKMVISGLTFSAESGVVKTIQIKQPQQLLIPKAILKSEMATVFVNNSNEPIEIIKADEANSILPLNGLDIDELEREVKKATERRERVKQYEQHSIGLWIIVITLTVLTSILVYVIYKFKTRKTKIMNSLSKYLLDIIKPQTVESTV